MYIYNVTTNIQESIHEEWLKWMKEVHIPDILDTGKFLSAKMTKVLVEEEMGGVTYSVQFTTVDKKTLQNYYNEDADRLRQKVTNLFAGRFVSFRTELEVISETTARPLASTEYLFTYGTLQNITIQKAVFGRALEGTSDTLSGYKIASEKVLGTYPVIIKTAHLTDVLEGKMYQITPQELKRADSYEGELYKRTAVVLSSGKTAWVYMGKGEN
jgi:gamma-glutamylcyclotransferase (GGCT)/AIG2-like uncharacterized protein YtfP